MIRKMTIVLFFFSILYSVYRVIARMELFRRQFSLILVCLKVYINICLIYPFIWCVQISMVHTKKSNIVLERKYKNCIFNFILLQITLGCQ